MRIPSLLTDQRKAAARKAIVDALNSQTYTPPDGSSVPEPLPGFTSGGQSVIAVYDGMPVYEWTDALRPVVGYQDDTGKRLIADHSGFSTISADKQTQPSIPDYLYPSINPTLSMPQSLSSLQSLPPTPSVTEEDQPWGSNDPSGNDLNDLSPDSNALARRRQVELAFMPSQPLPGSDASRGDNDLPLDFAAPTEGFYTTRADPTLFKPTVFKPIPKPTLKPTLKPKQNTLAQQRLMGLASMPPQPLLGSDAAFEARYGHAPETAQSLRFSDPRDRFDYYAGSGSDKRLRDLKTAKQAIVEQGLPTVVALGASALTEGAASPMLAETALGQWGIRGLSMLAGMGAGAGTSLAQDAIANNVNPVGMERFRRNKAELQKRDPLTYAIIENVPQLLISGPSTELNIGSRLTGGAIGAGLDVAGRAVTGQKQDLAGTGASFLVGTLASGGSPLEEKITSPFYAAGERLANSPAGTAATNYFRPRLSSADAALGRAGAGVVNAARRGANAAGDAYDWFTADMPRPGEALFVGIPVPGRRLETKNEGIARRIREQADEEKFGKPVIYASSQEVGGEIPNISAYKRDWSRLVGSPYNRKDGLRIINGYYNQGAYERLLGKPGTVNHDVIYIPAPSTSGNNILPQLLAERLKQDFGGEIINNLVENHSSTEAKTNTNLVNKIRSKREIKTTDKYDPSMFVGKRPIIVEDIVTTGDTAIAIKKALGLPQDTPIASLGAAEPYPARLSDINRFALLLYQALSDERYNNKPSGLTQRKVDETLRKFFKTKSSRLLSYAEGSFNTKDARQRGENALTIWNWINQ